MKKTKATKALLRALLASYNSYINNKKAGLRKKFSLFSSYYKLYFTLLKRKMILLLFI